MSIEIRKMKELSLLFSIQVVTLGTSCHFDTISRKGEEDMELYDVILRDVALLNERFYYRFILLFRMLRSLHTSGLDFPFQTVQGR